LAEGVLDHVTGCLAAGLVALGAELFAGDALLFAAEQVQWDGLGVGQFQELAAFDFESGAWSRRVWQLRHVAGRWR